jgi:hypothetical protein
MIMVAENQLRFSDASIDETMVALEIFTKQARRSLIVYQGSSPSDEMAAEFFQRVKNRDITVELINSDSSLHDRASVADGVFLFVSNASELTKLLVKFASGENLFIWAPRTAHYYMSRPVLVQSVPKCGTHLLFECLKAFGLKEPESYDLPDYTAKLHDGHFYNLQHMPMDYLSRPYQQIAKFVDNLCRSPILFIVRDPRDAALSLAHYLASKKDYHILAALFRKMPLDERLDRVIAGNYPLPVYINDCLSFGGDIRDLFMLYKAWWCDNFPNVWLVRFEELIGPLGGGDYAEQLKTVWGLQLALHVPGAPSDYAHKIFSATVATFRRGQIGDYLNEFSVKHHQYFEKAQELFVPLGYADRWNITGNIRIKVVADQLESAQAFIAALKREISIHSRGCIFFRQQESRLQREGEETTKTSFEVSIECARTSSEQVPAEQTNEGSVTVVIREFESTEGPVNRSRFAVGGEKIFSISLGEVSFPEVIALFMETLVERKVVAKLERNQRKSGQACSFSGEIENCAQSYVADLNSNTAVRNGKRRVIELVGETGGFNLVRVGKRFLAVAKSLGPTELMVERLGDRELQPLVFIEKSLREVRDKVTRFERENAFPEIKLIEEVDNYNIVAAGNRFVAVAKKLGPVDLFRERLGERDLPPFILTAPDLPTLRQSIAGRISGFFSRVRG